MKRRFTKQLLTSILAASMAVTPQIGTLSAYGATSSVKQSVIKEATSGESKLADSDTLFSEYVNQLFKVPKKRGNIRHAPRRNRLTGQNLIVYNALKSAVTDIANGKRSSSVVEIPIKTLLDGKLSYSTEELKEETGSENEDDWEKAFLAKITVDPSKVMSALMDDCPYDLYWYDKTAGYSYTRSGYHLAGDNYYFDENAVYSITFCASANYSESGKKGTSDLNTSRTSAASKAVEKAKDIAKNAEGMSDDEALKYFKEQICALVSYNSGAADSSKDIPYGDPWQIIYVFDGDPDTNVVCEGYAKAFKYLCDLHTFNDPKLDVYTVSGTMEGGTGAGRHMWNLVRKSTGTYLVDVTNSDDGTVGADGDLFMAKADSLIQATDGRVGGYQYIADNDGNCETITYTYDAKVLNDFDQSELTPMQKGESDKYPVIIKNAANGSVKAAANSATKNDRIYVEVSPAEGYALDTIDITDGSHKSIAVSKDNNNYYFNMPQSEVIISATFKKEEVQVASITFDRTSVELTEGDETSLTATVAPENATNKSVEWTSDNTSVASVDENGKVTALKAGTATITATAKDGSGKSASCIVTVKEKKVPVTGITLNQTTVDLAEGDETSLTATVAPENATNKSVEWKSDNISVASVNENGKVTALKAGKATITAAAKDGSGKSASCIVTVKEKKVSVTGITLNQATAELTEGDETTLTAAVLPENASNKSVEWTSDNTSVASVDEKGKVMALKTGTATITAAAKDGSGKSASCTITVKAKKVPVTNITLSTVNEMNIGDEITLEATVEPDNATNKALTWSSADEKVASVDANGKVKALASGTTTITATAQDGSDVKAERIIIVKDTEPINKEALNKAIENAKSFASQSDKYTAESISILNKAIENAQTVANKADATEEEVEKANKTIEDALKNLALVKEVTPNPSEPGKGGETTPTKPSEPGRGGGTTPTKPNEGGKTSESVPKPTPVPDKPQKMETSVLYRLYNPNSGEHFYTLANNEKEALVKVGWVFEGTAWNAPKKGIPVYRLYNPNAGDHHYTTALGERDMLIKLGWKFEGIGWYAAEKDTVGAIPVYRQYNPNAKSGAHNFTANKSENDYLAKIGWQAEGIAWYTLE